MNQVKKATTFKGEKKINQGIEASTEIARH